MVIGVAGDGPMAQVLPRFLDAKRIGPRPIEVRVVHSGSELRACNVVILVYPDDSRMRQAIGEIEKTSIVSIGSGEEFVRRGGMIAFVPNKDTFHLAINLHTADRARIKISAKVLKLAELLPDNSEHAKP